MHNKAMERKLRSGDAIDVSGLEHVTVAGQVHYFLNEFCEGKDYCDSKTERWIWSIGKRPDGIIIASTGVDFYQNPNFECLWLR